MRHPAGHSCDLIKIPVRPDAPGLLGSARGMRSVAPGRAFVYRRQHRGCRRFGHQRWHLRHATDVCTRAPPSSRPTPGPADHRAACRHLYPDPGRPRRQNAASGDLDVSDDLTLRGAGVGITIIDAAGLDRALRSDRRRNAARNFGVTITTARETQATRPTMAPARHRSQGILTLRDSTITNSVAVQHRLRRRRHSP